MTAFGSQKGLFFFNVITTLLLMIFGYWLIKVEDKIIDDFKRDFCRCQQVMSSNNQGGEFIYENQ